MKSMFRSKRFLAVPVHVAGILSLGLLLAGCSNVALNRMAPTNVAATVRPDIRKYNLRNIAVMPFRNNTGTGDAGHRVASFFYNEISTHKKYTVTPPVRLETTEEIELEFRVDPSRRAGMVNREENLRMLGRAVSKYLKRVQPYTTGKRLLFPGELPDSDPEEERMGPTGEVRSPEVTAGDDTQKLDAVVTGVITRYNDRNGNALAAERPASVSFDVYLISVEDGRVLWSATFDETQASLDENLLLLGRFLKGGGVWQSHDTLARIGMSRILDTFPGLASQLREGAPEPSAVP